MHLHTSIHVLTLLTHILPDTATAAATSNFRNHAASSKLSTAHYQSLSTLRLRHALSQRGIPPLPPKHTAHFEDLGDGWHGIPTASSDVFLPIQIASQRLNRLYQLFIQHPWHQASSYVNSGSYRLGEFELMFESDVESQTTLPWWLVVVFCRLVQSRAKAGLPMISKGVFISTSGAIVYVRLVSLDFDDAS